MHCLPENTWKEWKKKRRHTLIGFAVAGIAMGIDGSVVFSTLYLYLSDLVKTDQPEMWYGLIIAFFFVSSTVVGMFCGRWLDKTRKVRLYVNMSILVQIVGFLLYTIPYHAGFLLLGRTICGMGDPFTGVVSGEVFRVYSYDESTRAMILLSSVYSFGFLIGPVLNFFFAGIEFQIGPFEINHLNFIGIFMAVLFCIVLVVANCLVHDCSMEFDLKDHLQIVSIDTNSEVDTPEDAISGIDLDNGTITYNKIIKSPLSDDSNLSQVELEINNASETTNLLQTPLSQTLPIKVVLKNILSNKDALLIFVATFVFVYALFTASVLFPLLVTITLNWNLKTLSILYVASGIFGLVFLLIMAKYCNTYRTVYFICLVSIISQTLICCLLICFKLLERDFRRDVFMIFIFLLATTLGWFFDDVLIRVMFANMIPSEVQSFCETLRSGVSRIAIVAGSFTVTTLLPWVHWWSAGIIVCNCLLLMGFIIRRQYLFHPTEIPFIR